MQAHNWTYTMDGNISGRGYEHELDLDYEEEEWRHDRVMAPTRMTYQHHYPMVQRPSMSTVRMSQHSVRKTPLIIRKIAHPHPRAAYNHQTAQQHFPVRPIIHPIRMIKIDQTHHSVMGHSRGMMERESSNRELQYQVPYANEETVRTSDDQEEREEEEDEMGMHSMQDHSIKRLEDDLEVDVEGVSDGPSTSMPKMIVRTKTLPVFHPAENKALIENHQLKSRISTLIDTNFKFRDEISTLREEKRELLKQFRKQEKVIEKQSIELAESERRVIELQRKDKEKDKRFERELNIKDKRRKAITVMPCLPNRKVVFSKATKQAQSLRLRLLHRYLGELCGPVDGEHRLEEKNFIVLRWRKAHAPKPSLEIGRQLLPSEEEEFCHRFGIVGERKKEMKKWLGQKHIDLFGPSERAIAVRKWRMGQREKKRRGEKEDKMIDVEEEVLDEVGNDTDDDELMDDIESVLEEEAEGGEKSADECALSTHILDEEEEEEEAVMMERGIR